MKEAKLYSPILFSLLSYALGYSPQISDVKEVLFHCCCVAEDTITQNDPNHHVMDLEETEIMQNDAKIEVNETGMDFNVS